MGSDPRDLAPPFANECPQQRLALSAFRISRVPVTNALYQHFVMATNYPAPGHWPTGQLPAGAEDWPVTYVSWLDAQAFCAWAGVRLPSEAEWEKAARGPAVTSHPQPPIASNDRWWPWGDTLPDSTRCHFDGQAQGVAPAAQQVMPVGQLPLGASPYGVLDLAGNVWEWTNSHYQRYPYCADDGREAVTPSGIRVVRGGSYNHNARQIRCAARDGMAAGVRDVYIGFRVALSGTGAEGASCVPPSLDFDWVTIPAGAFVMGSCAPARPSAVLSSELPQHYPDLPEFQIAQTPVTNADYADFVGATGHPAPAHWLDGMLPSGLARHPVTHVDWVDAQAFCTWATVRLPTEAQWEKAARGPLLAGERARIYPWGDEPPDSMRLNYRQKGKRVTTTSVDAYPHGASPYGVLDMGGNVWEWVNSLYAPYPYHADDGREQLSTEGPRVLRGGSFASPSARYVRCAMRSLSYPTRRREHIGFRVVQ